jgi:hypothetical protein
MACQITDVKIKLTNKQNLSEGDINESYLLFKVFRNSFEAEKILPELH